MNKYAPQTLSLTSPKTQSSETDPYSFDWFPQLAGLGFDALAYDLLSGPEPVIAWLAMTHSLARMVSLASSPFLFV